MVGLSYAQLVAGRSLSLQVDPAVRLKNPGYVRAVREGDFLAVVATDEWAAIRASTTVVGEGPPQPGAAGHRPLGRRHERHRPPVAGELRLPAEHARLDRAIARGGRIQGRAAHGVGALAESHLLQKQFATMLRLAPERVRCIYAGCAVSLGRPMHGMRLAWASLALVVGGAVIALATVALRLDGFDGSRPGARALLVDAACHRLFLADAPPIVTADWKADSSQRWTVSLGGGVGKIFHLGKLPVNTQLSAYYNVVKPDNGANWQIRVQAQFMFPN